MPAIVQPKYTPDRKHYPSVLAQGFNCRIFNFGKAESPGTAYFNPGLVQRPDGLWLVARKSEATKHLRIGMNSLMAFRLDDKKSPQLGYPVQCGAKFDREHFEDPRVIFHHGKTIISCCNFIVYPNQIKEKWTGAHICLQIIPYAENNWGKRDAASPLAARRIDPVYGNNEASLSTVKGLEKNWLWFYHKNQLHLLYQSVPQTVVRWEDNGTTLVKVEEWSCENEMAAWAYGDLRGGTPPVFHDGLYWTFFHSSIPVENKYRRRYYMGAYAFEPFPPFKIVKFTKEPLMAGSDEDPWAEKKPLVVFPCGAIYEKDQWFVTMGVNDMLSAWVEIPHDTLLAKMGERRRNVEAWVRTAAAAVTTAVIAYLPPPNVGHTQIFLKNLSEHPPASKLMFISDYPWPDSERIPDPTQFCQDKDKIAAYVFLKALELAEKRGLETFIYLETDCRVAGLEWDKVLLHEFAQAKGEPIAAGNMAVMNASGGSFLFKIALSGMTQQHTACDADKSTNQTAILMQGTAQDKTCVFVNGAPSVYSVKALRSVLGNEPLDKILERLTNSDESIGQIYAERNGAGHALKSYVHTPQVMATAGETIYPFHARVGALDSGKAKAVHPIKNRWRPRTQAEPTFYHCGDLGDIIYSLKAIQLYGGGKLVLGPKCYSKYPPRSPISKDVFKLLQPLLDQQKYLSSVSFSESWNEWDYDMNDFRQLWNECAKLQINPGTLCKAHCYFLGVEPLWDEEPWLTAEVNRLARFVIHRSPRYREEAFPWKDIVARFQSEILFVGLPEEHHDFINRFGNVQFLQPFNFSQLAAAINGADVAIMNQSLPCSIALGLGKRVWQETWLKSPDCVFNRPHTFYNGIAFPEHWINP